MFEETHCLKMQAQVFEPKEDKKNVVNEENQTRK